MRAFDRSNSESMCSCKLVLSIASLSLILLHEIVSGVGWGLSRANKTHTRPTVNTMLSFNDAKRKRDLRCDQLPKLKGKTDKEGSTGSLRGHTWIVLEAKEVVDIEG